MSGIPHVEIGNLAFFKWRLTARQEEKSDRFVPGALSGCTDPLEGWQLEPVGFYLPQIYSLWQSSDSGQAPASITLNHLGTSVIARTDVSPFSERLCLQVSDVVLTANIQ